MTMSRETRRVVVAHLAECGMDPATIAAELDVSKETVRRDLHNRPAKAADPVADADTLVLRLDEPLRESLTVLRQVCNGPDTEAQHVAAARAAIHATADHIRERTFART